MKYITIYHTLRQNQVTIIRQLFKEHDIKHRILDEAKNNAIPAGVKVQVQESQVKRAKDLLKEYGFLGIPGPEPDSGFNIRFLWYLLFAIILLVVVSVLVNRL